VVALEGGAVRQNTRQHGPSKQPPERGWLLG